MMTPIFRLGYRPLTLRRPPPTRRAGSDDRIWSTTILAPSTRPVFEHHANKSTSVSIVTSSLRLISLRLDGVRIPHASLIDQVAEPLAILNSFPDIRRQFVRNVDRKSFAATSPVQYV